MSKYYFDFSMTPNGVKRRASVKASRYSQAFAKFKRWSMSHNNVYLHKVSSEAL